MPAVTPAKPRAASTVSKSRVAPASKRTNDPERTVAEILTAATREFADKGLSGARIEAIAAAMSTKKFMIYYYFGSKEALYIAVLEDAYQRIRKREAGLHLSVLPPVDALRRLVRFAFDYHNEHPDFVRLVMGENMTNGKYLAQSAVIRELNSPVIDDVKNLYARGVADGTFRKGLNPVDIHMTISALSFHYVSNRSTFSLIFEPGSGHASTVKGRREAVTEAVLRYVLSDPDQSEA
jgi:AcrR family transcriptional regulator